MKANKRAQLEHVATLAAGLAIQRVTGKADCTPLILDPEILSQAEREDILTRFQERGLSPVVVLGPLELAGV